MYQMALRGGPVNGRGVDLRSVTRRQRRLLHLRGTAWFAGSHAKHTLPMPTLMKTWAAVGGYGLSIGEHSH